ncbi:MAG: carbon-nitrogen hydrolase [Desulfuromonadales bacterium]|nr:carbon-nitrogen hydrolase [Desulfuromonadales bacterium]MBN2791082.1 carbon-nitrogen hydrolase [Desulfuromonadales bacterium]
MNNLAIGLVQHSCTADIDANIQKSIDGIKRAADLGAELVVLQELHRTPYFCQSEEVTNFDLAEEIPGPTTEIFAALAQECRVVVVLSLFERRAAGLYHNTAVVLEKDGSIAGTYRKMHIPDDPGYYEKFYFTPGDLGFQPIDTSLGKLGVLICWDQWFPEAARLMTLAGAEILIYPTAIGFDPNDSREEQQRQMEAWITVQRGHAVANGIPLVAVNRVGFEADPSGRGQGARFWGNSFVAGPQGEMIFHSGEDEGVFCVEVKRDQSEAVRRIWPFLRDRRIDAYQDLIKRFRD